VVNASKNASEIPKNNRIEISNYPLLVHSSGI